MKGLLSFISLAIFCELKLDIRECPQLVIVLIPIIRKSNQYEKRIIDLGITRIVSGGL
jgi:hypothetical protein